MLKRIKKELARRIKKMMQKRAAGGPAGPLVIIYYTHSERSLKRLPKQK
jgi:hypothetical protein